MEDPVNQDDRIQHDTPAPIHPPESTKQQPQPASKTNPKLKAPAKANMEIREACPEQFTVSSVKTPIEKPLRLHEENEPTCKDMRPETFVKEPCAPIPPPE